MSRAIKFGRAEARPGAPNLLPHTRRNAQNGDPGEPLLAAPRGHVEPHNGGLDQAQFGSSISGITTFRPLCQGAYHGLRGQPITHTLFRKNTNQAHRLPGTRITFMGPPMLWWVEPSRRPPCQNAAAMHLAPNGGVAAERTGSADPVWPQFGPLSRPVDRPGSGQHRRRHKPAYDGRTHNQRSQHSPDNPNRDPRPKQPLAH